METSVRFSKNYLMINGSKFVPFIKYREIRNKVKEIARQIQIDYKGKIPVFVVVLNGGIFFATELMKHLLIPLRVETLKAKSYGNEMYTSGKVQLFLTCDDLEGRDLIIVEDIIDTGLTMKTIISELQKYKPNSIEIATLLLKRSNLKTDLQVKYCGFEIPNKFVIGFGLDYAEFGRNLKGIYILE
ncbi:MAG: hypoxanthine phosphoribosyltransferase [Candidatus Kapaibacteriota bacterium]